MIRIRSALRCPAESWSSYGQLAAHRVDVRERLDPLEIVLRHVWHLDAEAAKGGPFSPATAEEVGQLVTGDPE